MLNLANHRQDADEKLAGLSEAHRAAAAASRSGKTYFVVYLFGHGYAVYDITQIVFRGAVFVDAAYVCGQLVFRCSPVPARPQPHPLKLVSNNNVALLEPSQKRCAMAGSCPIQAASIESGFTPVTGVFALLNEANEALDGMMEIEPRQISHLMQAVNRLHLKLYHLYTERRCLDS